jgi:hypothetical protein
MAKLLAPFLVSFAVVIACFGFHISFASATYWGLLALAQCAYLLGYFVARAE